MVAILCVPDVRETFYFFSLTTLWVPKIQNLIKPTFLFCVSIYPLRNSRIVRYNTGIGGQSENSHFAQDNSRIVPILT